MNFFESELKKIMGDSAILKDQKYVGRMCYGTIGGDLRARVEFVTLGVSDHYAGIKASVINRKEGVVDSILLQFSKVSATFWYSAAPGRNTYQSLFPLSVQIWGLTPSLKLGLLTFCFPQISEN